MSEGMTAEAIVGKVDFRYTEDEFIAAHRAMKLAANRFHDTRLGRLGPTLLGHFLLLGSALALATPFKDDQLPLGPRLIQHAVELGLGVLGGWLVYRWCYGYRRRWRRRFRKFPWAGTKVCLTFTPGRLITSNEKSDASADWSLYPDLFELRDGFLLMSRAKVGLWIPKRAFEPGFDAEAAGAFLRSKAARSRRIGRYARLPE